MGKQYLLMWHRTDQWEEEKSVDICGNFVSSLASGLIWQQYKDVLFCLVTTVRPVDCVRMFSISKVPLDQDDWGECVVEFGRERRETVDIWDTDVGSAGQM